MKPALEALREYLELKKIKYEAAVANSIWFLLLIPTPENKEMPNRFVSCGVRIPENNNRVLYFSATVLAVETEGGGMEAIASSLMKFQSAELKSGRIALHPDGTISYSLTQFLCTEGTMDIQAVSALMMTAILEIASLFLMRENAVKLLPLTTVRRIGTA